MIMSQKLEFDCRSINNGSRCPHLYSVPDHRIGRVPSMFICKDKNIVILPELLDKGKPTEEIISIAPIHYCSEVGKLQAQGIAQWAVFSISQGGTGTNWNPEIK